MQLTCREVPAQGLFRKISIFLQNIIEPMRRNILLQSQELCGDFIEPAGKHLSIVLFSRRGTKIREWLRA